MRNYSELCHSSTSGHKHLMVKFTTSETGVVSKKYGVAKQRRERSNSHIWAQITSPPEQRFGRTMAGFLEAKTQLKKSIFVDRSRQGPGARECGTKRKTHSKNAISLGPLHMGAVYFLVLAGPWGQSVVVLVSVAPWTTILHFTFWS